MVVNPEGEIVTDSQPPKGDSNSIGVTEPLPETQVADNPVPKNKEHEVFINYMKKIRKVVVMPEPSDADFCPKIRSFIETRGEGMASSDELIKAYDLFQKHCVERIIEEEKTENQQQPKVISENKNEGEEKQEPKNQVAEPVISELIGEYKNSDSKLITFDDDLGLRPISIKKIKKITEVDESTNKKPYLFFLVILGIATLAYAINKKN